MNPENLSGLNWRSRMRKKALLHNWDCLQVSCIVIDSNLSVIKKAAKGMVLKFAL